MSDRGSYSQITRVLLDGPDFQRLSAVARWTLVALKIAFGPCGIEVQYPDSLESDLAHRTGYPRDDVAAALLELEQAGWIRREANVCWIVDHLRFSPALKVDNVNHRRGVQNHVAGLPHLAIVNAFATHYAGFFQDSVIAYPMAIEGHSNGYRITENETENETEHETENEVVSATAENLQNNCDRPGGTRLPGEHLPAGAVAGTNGYAAAKKPRARKSLSDNEQAVLEHYQRQFPERRPGDKDVKAIRKALANGYSPADLKQAIDGNANDAWHCTNKKHAIAYVLRDNGTIDDFRARALAAKPLLDGDWYSLAGELETRPPGFRQ